MNWDTYFMDIAHTVSTKSKDPEHKIGAVIVDMHLKPISFGFNGFISCCDEAQMTFDPELKKHLVIHAEMNALLFAHTSVNGGRIYITQAPCASCLRSIFQSGIYEVVYDRSDDVIYKMTTHEKSAILRLISSMGNRVIVCDLNGDTYAEKIQASFDFETNRTSIDA